MDHPACVSVEGTPDVRAAFSGPGDRHIDRLEARLGVKVDWLETQAVNPFYRITKIQ
jgi:ribonuclease G